MIKQIEENLGLTNKNKSIIHNFLFTHNNSASKWGRRFVRIYFDFRKRSCVEAAFKIISPISSLSPRFMLRIYILCYGQGWSSPGERGIKNRPSIHLAFKVQDILQKA